MTFEKIKVTKADVGTLTVGTDGTPNIQAGTASVAGHAGQGKSPVAAIVQAAMVEAVKACQARGIRDPAIIKGAQRKARDRAIADITARLTKT